MTKKNTEKKELRNNITEIVFILDRSGSMGGLESDTTCRQVQVLTADEISDMTDKEYFVRGSTALLDAIGSTVSHISSIHKYVRKEDVPSHTIFVITTDGMENSSREYSSGKVKKMIEKKKEDGWEFLVLGANIDAVETARGFGINEECAVNYHSDAKGTALNYACLSRAIGSVRRKGKMDAAWREEIDADFESRG